MSVYLRLRAIHYEYCITPEEIKDSKEFLKLTLTPQSTKVGEQSKTVSLPTHLLLHRAAVSQMGELEKY